MLDGGNRCTMISVNPTTSYRWKPLADLPGDPRELTSRELEALQLVWAEQKESLAQGGALEEFHRQLGREWSIETGIIEGVYTLDRGITRTLIELGINASLIPHEATDRDPELVARIVQDHSDTLEEMFAFVKGERALTAGYIKELHAALLRHQDTATAMDQFGNLFEKKLEKGSYKRLPNNPTRPDGLLHEYCPPEHVASELDRIIELHGKHVREVVPVEVEAAWLHHVFTQIHPFEDGNGRVARAIATLVFLKAELFPLVVTRDDRAKYIEALEIADQGDLKPLVALFTQIQKRAVVKAVAMASQARPAQTVEEAIGAARALLIAKGQIPPSEWERVKSTANGLFNVTVQRCHSVTQKLQQDIESVRPGFAFRIAPDSGAPPGLESVAAQLHYVANPKEFHRFVQITLRTEREARLTVSFHALGSQFRGLIAVSAFFEMRDNALSSPVAVTEDIFQINYKEDPSQAQNRFRPWLEAAIVKGLSLWRAKL
ncbi:MAG: Fic family protein [Bryobacteraceae bacterium]